MSNVCIKNPSVYKGLQATNLLSRTLQKVVVENPNTES
jgi:hypothetical protein